MLHHDPRFVEGLAAERRSAAARRRPPADAAELERVVTAAAAGRRDAWAALVDRFTARLRVVTRAHRLPAHDAEEVVQATWLKLIEHIDEVRDPLAIGAWLETTARRESLGKLIAARRERPSDEELGERAATPPVDDERLTAADRQAALSGAVERLPRRQQRLLAMLADPDEPSYQEIARALDMPIGSIGPTRQRILVVLRRDPRIAALADR